MKSWSFVHNMWNESIYRYDNKTKQEKTINRERERFDKANKKYYIERVYCVEVGKTKPFIYIYKNRNSINDYEWMIY